VRCDGPRARGAAVSHTHRSSLRTGVARALRYAPRSARADLGRVTARRVRRATQKALSRVAAGVDVEGVAWPTRREHGDPWSYS
jgi:hypothetical protein